MDKLAWLLAVDYIEQKVLIVSRKALIAFISRVGKKEKGSKDIF